MNTQAPIERIIISLTSIKAREAALKETCTSLVQQDFDAHYEVRVNLSHEPYLMDEGFADAPVWVADLQKLNSRCTLQVSLWRLSDRKHSCTPSLLKQRRSYVYGCALLSAFTSWHRMHHGSILLGA